MQIDVTIVNNDLKKAVRRIVVKNIHEAKSIVYGIENVDLVSIIVWDGIDITAISRYPRLKSDKHWQCPSYSQNIKGDALLKRFKKARYVK